MWRTLERADGGFSPRFSLTKRPPARARAEARASTLKRAPRLNTLVLIVICLIFVGWKYTHPVRDLRTVLQSRWPHRYSEEYKHGYIRGRNRARWAMEDIEKFAKSGVLGVNAFSSVARAVQNKKFADLEAEVKTIDELKGGRDAFHDVMDGIREKVD